MEDKDIPEEVLRFIVNHIDSVPHLEALLLMWEAPTQTWTEEEIAARVYVKREQARALLQDLARHRFITTGQDAVERYLYDPTWDEARILPKVASAYRRQLIRVANLIHAKAPSAVREFARAFKIKSED